MCSRLTYFSIKYAIHRANSFASITFSVLKKCMNKLDCLVHEMLLIRQLVAGSASSRTNSSETTALGMNMD